MSWKPFISSDYDDIQYYWRDDGQGGGEVLTVQDCTETVERAKAMATHNDGYSPSKEWKRAGSVPFTLLYKWIAEAGIEANDPERQQKINKLCIQKLNDSDYRHLRTIPGRAG
jgi:hypothetical protein